MALKKKPVTGMKDILPGEMELRDYLMDIIKETYSSYGFTPIATPAVEHIENLSSKQGGDNEKLIFKILKRGEKLKLDTAESDMDISDSGLRYDLTLPLSRYYANNQANLPLPFKAVQIGSVWRAERPQKGRFRQFTQCDIDIIGDGSYLAEVELILATTTALSRACPGHRFTVRINDRAILRAMVEFAGFEEGRSDEVFIILDKMDKIGLEGVKSELEGAGFDPSSVEKYLALFGNLVEDDISLRELGEKLGAVSKPEAIDNIASIMELINSCKNADYDVVFDPTLVRGMGYYTGTIFEVSMEGFAGSVAGGGRYDKMIGRFTGKDTPACGFSIGFERIIGILTDSDFKPEAENTKKAYLYEKGMDIERMALILKKAQEDRLSGNKVLVSVMNKNKKFQKEQLIAQNYELFEEFYIKEWNKD